MRPDPDTMGPRLSHREPRRFLRCGVTRLVRSTAIPLLILAGMALTPTEVGAASITYDVVNYPDLQNGYNVSGTITTDGTIGTALPSTHITSWDITLSQASTAISTFDPTNGAMSGPFNATPTEILAGPTLSVSATNNGAIQWGVIVDIMSPDVYFGLAPPPGGILWGSPFNRATQPVAIVPEPSSAVLAVIGAVSVVACGLVRRRRAQPRPSDAGHTQPTE